MIERGGLAVALLALLALCPNVSALPLLSGHHRAGGGTPPAPPDRLTVSGAILDPAEVGDDGALDVEMVGDVVIGTPPDHAGITVCTGRCQIAPPLRSRVLIVRPDSRLVLAADWSAPAGANCDLDASSVVTVRGTLSGTLVVSVSGSPAALPALVLSATAITATITPGALPPGTRLFVSATAVYLEPLP